MEEENNTVNKEEIYEYEYEYEYIYEENLLIKK